MAGTNFTQPPPAGPGLEPRDEVDQQLLELVPGVAIVIINSFINQAAKFLARAQRLSTRGTVHGGVHAPSMVIAVWWIPVLTPPPLSALIHTQRQRNIAALQ